MRTNVLIECKDFNGANLAVSERYAGEWEDVKAVLRSLPLHIKASDQAGMQGEQIFDVVGTNAFI